MEDRTQRLTDKVCIVTGAGRNIGRGMAERFAQEGAKVAVIDIDEESGKAVASDINEANSPGEAQFVQCDLSSEEDVASMAEAVVAEWGRIDGLVNNVAYSVNKSVLDVTEDEWDRVFGVTLKSAFFCTKHVAPIMGETDGGAIVNVASTSAHRGTPEKVAYCTAKSGILNFTRQTAVDLADDNIRVNTISPTRTGSAVGYEEGGPMRNTKGILRDRLGEPRDHAAAAAYLLSDESDFITGIELPVEGGTLATF
jgi:NAD(P)-dependent dehydrogenase (short-subunit alcohol dehydrogenase family)